MAKQPLKMKLTEKDIETMVRSVCFHLKESVDNPFSLPESFKNNPLNEGVFETYRPEDVEKYLKKRYGEYAYVDRYKNENNVEIFRIGFYNEENAKKIIEKDMSLCGYFPSKEQLTNNGEMLYITYEPTHQKNVNEKVYEKDTLYHLTTTNMVGKILTIGLVPKTKNKMFKYPNRIYCFLDKPSKKESLNLMKQFYQIELNNGKKQIYEGSYTLLAIDTKKINNIDFSYDPNAEGCVYTYDNIPPSAIEIVCEIEQEYLK